jgi:hypothetical protein
LFRREPLVILRRCRIALGREQLIEARALRRGLLKHHLDVTDPESRFDRPLIVTGLRQRMYDLPAEYRGGKAGREHEREFPDSLHSPIIGGASLED